MPERLSRREYLIYGGGGLFLVLSMVLYSLEFRHFENLLNTRLFLIISATIGGLIGLYIAWRLRKKGSDLTERIQIFVFFIILAIVFTPLWASISNRMFSFYPAKTVEAEFWEQRVYYASRAGFIKGELLEPTGVYTFLFLDKKLVRIETKFILYPGKERGEMVELKLKRGLWGMPFLIIEEP